MDKTPFWGLRETQSKGMRLTSRLIWHYFTYQETWAMGKGMFTICRATWPDNEVQTLAKRVDKPPRTECCAKCHRDFNKRQGTKSS